MTTNTIINVFGAIVTVALVAVVVQSPQSANVINAFGSAFSGSIKAAMGSVG